MKKSFVAVAAALVLAGSSSLVFANGSHKGGHEERESSVGAPGQAANVTRTVNVDMADTMRFNPGTIHAIQGETIRFVVKNLGQVEHEFVLGSEKELKEHYAMMLKMPEMEHGDANAVSVAPGKSGELIWQFTQAGKIDFACLQPGHYDAGMKGAVNVAALTGGAKSTGRLDPQH